MTGAVTIVQDQPKDAPFIVRIIEPPSELAGLADVLLGALGLTGVLVLAAVLFGVVLAGVILWFRSRSN